MREVWSAAARVRRTTTAFQISLTDIRPLTQRELSDAYQLQGSEKPHTVYLVRPNGPRDKRDASAASVSPNGKAQARRGLPVELHLTRPVT